MSESAADSGINALHDAVLAALPGSMQEIADRVGVQGQPLWDAVHTLRKAGVILRRGGAKCRVFELAAAPKQFVPAPDASPGVVATELAKEEKKQRKRPVILFYIPDWPSQDPNRRMVWTIVWAGRPTAERELKRLKRKFKKDANWELANLSPNEVRRMRTRGYDLREVRDREKAMREKDAQTQS